MTRAERIKSLLTEGLSPRTLEVTDDSAKHAGHAGAKVEGETHYSVVIEAERFLGMSKVQRHQAIYGLLAAEFKTGLHALSIEARAPGNSCHSQHGWHIHNY